MITGYRPSAEGRYTSARSTVPSGIGTGTSQSMRIPSLTSLRYSPLSIGLLVREEVEVSLGERGRVLQRDVVTGRGDDGAADVAGHLRELFGYFVPEIGLRADGQDRAADRVGVMRAVLLGVGLAGAVHLQDGPGAARLLDRAHHLVDVVLGQSAGVPHLAPGEVRPERPFPPGQQQLWQVGQAEEAEVPAGAAVVGGERGVAFAG